MELESGNASVTTSDTMKPLNRDPVGPGQESVWDYPRPPALEPVVERVRIEFGGQQIAESARALRILETSHPPTLYLPPDDFLAGVLQPTGKKTFCEWKGTASYFDVVCESRNLPAGAWYYTKPHPRYAELANYVSVYPGKMDACYLDEELVRAQAGDFYGGWITKKIVGPFKGGAGTHGW